MATGENNSPFGPSPFSELTLKIINMLKKPTLDSKLGETLDSFISELSISERYLNNGIVNIKFAEAGLFLESSASLYSKRVDLLWDNALEYQMQLCAYNKSQKENEKEAEKIVQRINRNKRKKIIQNVVEKLPCLDELIHDIDRSKKLLETASTMPGSDAVTNRWKEINTNKTVNDHSSEEASCRQEPPQPCSDFLCSLNQSVSLDSDERLASYNELIMNRLLPYFGSLCNIREPERIIGGNNQDWLLQKYLKHIMINYKKFWLERRGDDFNLFQQRIRQIDALLPSEANAVGLSNLSVVNLIRLPEDLMTDYTLNNDVHVRAMIHDLLVKERQISAARIKKSSERCSEADSGYHEMFNDSDSRSASRPDTVLMSQHSLVDSGIYEDQIPSVSSFHRDELELDTCETVMHVEEIPLCNVAATSNPAVLVDACNVEGNRGGSGDINREGVSLTCNPAADACNLEGNGDSNSPTVEDVIMPNPQANSVIIHSVITVPTVNSNSVEQNCTSVLTAEISDVTTSDLTVPEAATAPSDEKDLTASVSQENELSAVNRILGTLNDKSVTPEANSKDSQIGISRIITPVSITVRSFIKPLPEKKIETLKRKLVNDLNDEELFPKPKRKCVPRTKSLKTVVTLLERFERFYLCHYIPEDDEEGYLLAMDDDDDDSAQETLIPQSNISDSTNGITLDARENYIPNSIEVTNEVTETQTQNDSDNEMDSQCLLPSTSDSANPVSCDPISNITHDIVEASTSNCSSMHTLSRTKAVTDWKNFIEPKLRGLHRSEFDIHDYGGKIIDALPEEDALPFAHLVSNQKSSEVCRFFLASLQLANTYNIELTGPSGELANDTMRIKLLTKERYHEHLDEYEAPSENTFCEKLARAQAACPDRPVHSTPRQSKKRMRV
ncbi:hypothetical protein PPYR_04910 [Photinus pyralis]|uniref:Condensin-2 complex subunit H2 C-terminal domain-containing protein n=1 Tax=Photinus pyralis TaxID=7054 RepID=A0A1Y1KWK5_PHOPY|nr:uncharacterized protein LOC116165188 [Photinus pyralis]KAB0802724.1 hypothetical protein PPYR_04910 [Photinus pyralis]